LDKWQKGSKGKEKRVKGRKAGVEGKGKEWTDGEGTGRV